MAAGSRRCGGGQGCTIERCCCTTHERDVCTCMCWSRPCPRGLPSDPPLPVSCKHKTCSLMLAPCRPSTLLSAAQPAPTDLGGPAPALKREGVCHHPDGQDVELPRQLGDHWRCAGACAAPHAGCDEDHVGACQCCPDVLDTLKCGLLAQRRLHSRRRSSSRRQAGRQAARPAKSHEGCRLMLVSTRVRATCVTWCEVSGPTLI